MDITTQTARHALPDGQVHLLGAVSSVTGALTRAETGGACLLVDCGIAQGCEARSWSFPDAACSLRSVEGQRLRAAARRPRPDAHHRW